MTPLLTNRQAESEVDLNFTSPDCLLQLLCRDQRSWKLMIALKWGQRRKEVKNHFVSSHFLIFDSEMKNYVESRWEYWQYISSHKITFSVCDEGAGLCAMLMTVISLIMILVTLPFSLFFVVKVVQVRSSFNISIFCHQTFQEYERAVIFRLGRLLTGGARGPGVFFVIPCVDVYEKIDMRSQTYEIPPQEVSFNHQNV